MGYEVWKKVWDMEYYRVMGFPWFSLRTELVDTKSHGLLEVMGSHGDGL